MLKNKNLLMMVVTLMAGAGQLTEAARPGYVRQCSGGSCRYVPVARGGAAARPAVARPAARPAGAQANLSLEQLKANLAALIDTLMQKIRAGELESEAQASGLIRNFLVQNIQRGKGNALVGPSYINAARLAEWAINQNQFSAAQAIIDFIADTNAPGGVAAQQKSSAKNLQAKLNAALGLVGGGYDEGGYASDEEEEEDEGGYASDEEEEEVKARGAVRPPDRSRPSYRG